MDTLIPFDHTIKLKDNCNCPYELFFPEDMDHNNFHYEVDFIRPLREFLKRHTSFRTGEICDIKIPTQYGEIPDNLKDFIKNETQKGKAGSFRNCFGVN